MLKSLELTPTQPPLGDYIFPSAIEDSNLADTIQTSLPEFIGTASFGGKSFCSYALVRPPEIGVDETVIVYMLVGCEEFFPKNGLLEQGTSLSEPIAITLEKQSGKWQIVDRQKPDIRKWDQSIKEIFPQQSWAMVFGSTRTLLASRNAVYRILNKQNIQQAEDFYGIPFIPTPLH